MFRLKFLEPRLIREQLFKSKMEERRSYEGQNEDNEGNSTDEEDAEGEKSTIEVVKRKNEVQTEEEDAVINQRIRFNNILQKLEIGKLAVQV